jgi:hypothetical protein
MDIKTIEQKQLVERYLFGRLSPPEARFFEQMVRKSPQLADSMGLPEALRRTMHLLDETGTEWRERKPLFWHKPAVPLVLAAALALAVALAVTGWLGKRELGQRYAALRVEAEHGLLNAPTSSSILRVRPARLGEPPPVYPIGTRVSPSLAELRIDASFVKGNLFTAVIRRDDGTYWARLDNLLRDSNGELHIALNTSALAAGRYDLELESVNLRGDGGPVGRLGLRVEPR